MLNYGFGCKHVHQLRDIQDCFRVLIQNGEIVHNWTDLNVAAWDIEEVFPDPIQNDGCSDLFPRLLLCMLSCILYVLTTNVPPIRVSYGLFALKFAELWTGSNLSINITQVIMFCAVT